MFKKLFKKDKALVPKAIQSKVDDFWYTPVYHNDAISIVHDACVVCVDGKKQRTVDEKVQFIYDKVKIGHESILEHSNYIVLISFTGNPENLEALAEIMDCFKYLTVKVKQYEVENEPFARIELLIGGSVRGYKHIVRTIYNYNNPIYQTLLDYIKANIPSCFFSDLIEDDIFNKHDFMDVYYQDDDATCTIPEIADYRHKDYREMMRQGKDEGKTGIMLAYDNIIDISLRLHGKFTYYELMDFCMVNTVFVNVSRSCSHQLVRHRAGITQLSQRYVEMDGQMILPCTLNESQMKRCTLLLNDCNSLYKDLINEGIKKEDARYILPNACDTTVYMSFTFRNLIKAYSLRTGKGAQKEIKDAFKCLIPKECDFRNSIDTLEDIKMIYYIKPRYDFEALLAANSNVTE